MFPQKIKKAVKPLELLLIISSIISPVFSFSQGDTAKLKKEISAILKKYGYKDAVFNLKVESSNQKGGQTAFEINNYTGREIHVVNGNNSGINGNVNINAERELKESDKQPLINYINKLLKDNNSSTKCITVWSTPNTNTSKFIPQVISFLKSKGYLVSEEGQKTFVPMLRGVDISLKNNCIEISIGFL